MLSIDILLTFWTLLVIVLLATVALTADDAGGRRRGAAYRLARRDHARRHGRISPPG